MEDMLAKVELALAVKRGEGSQSVGCMDQLIETYRQVNGCDGDLCPN
jgi:hypothetical protein